MLTIDYGNTGADNEVHIFNADPVMNYEINVNKMNELMSQLKSKQDFYDSLSLQSSQMKDGL
jgi:hypothetical protein